MVMESVVQDPYYLNELFASVAETENDQSMEKSIIDDYSCKLDLFATLIETDENKLLSKSLVNEYAQYDIDNLLPSIQQ